MVECDDDESLPKPRAAEVHEVLALAAEASAAGAASVLATVLARRGSAPATPGQKLLLVADGACAGTLGGGALEQRALRAMVQQLDAARRGEATPETLELALGASLGMCCGGSVTVLLEPLAAAMPVAVVGGGHVAGALVPLLVSLGFAVTVCDPREGWSEASRFPGATVLRGDPTVLGGRVPTRGAVLVMTHDHRLDQDAILWALERHYSFVGGVGSRAKAQRTRARLEARGLSAEACDRVRMPLGLSIGARAPLEIAVSIAAELVAFRRGFALSPSQTAPRSTRVARPDAPAQGA